MKKIDFIEKVIILFGLFVEVIIILLIFNMLTSCNSPKKVMSNSKQNQETKINNDISTIDERKQTELYNQIITMLTNELLNVSIEKTKYNTEKPADPNSGKHPVAEETKINIHKEIEVNKKDSIHQETNNTAITTAKDNSQMDVKIKTETKEERQTGLSGLQKNLIVVGVISIVGLVIFIIYKVKK